MKSSAKLAAALTLTLPLALTLTACGSGGDSGGEGDGDNKLTVWTWDPAFNIYAMEEAEKVYQQDNPDFELEIVEVPWDDLQTKLTTIAQSQAFGELPDIFLMQNNAFQKNGLNYPDLFSDFSDSDIDFSEFPESVVEYSTIDDINYGVPFDAGTAVTALRTDVLEQAGYTVDDFTDITWDQYLTIGKDVLAKTGQPLLSGQAGSADIPMMMLQSAGASLFDDEGNPTIVDNEALEAAIDVYTQLVDAGVLIEVNSWDEYIGTIVNSNVGGTINGIWIVGSIQTAEDQAGKWGITNLPKLDTVSGATNYSANGGSSWAISSNADVDLALGLPRGDVRRLDRALRHDPAEGRRGRELDPRGRQRRVQRADRLLRRPADLRRRRRVRSRGALEQHGRLLLRGPRRREHGHDADHGRHRHRDGSGRGAGQRRVRDGVTTTERPAGR